MARVALTLLWLAAASMASAGGGQQVLDRVLARVGEVPVTLTDVRAARELGLIELRPGEGEEAALERMIERRLVLAEISRFPQPPPDPAAVDTEIARMTEVAAGRLDAITSANGIDQRRLRDLAADTIRIRAYIDQRFPPIPAANADALQYYRDHPQEFSRDGKPIPYDEAAPAARAAAAAQTRQGRVSRWLQNLRTRIDVVIPAAR
jgi:hypothetical protein